MSALPPKAIAAACVDSECIANPPRDKTWSPSIVMVVTSDSVEDLTEIAAEFACSAARKKLMQVKKIDTIKADAGAQFEVGECLR